MHTSCCLNLISSGTSIHMHCLGMSDSKYMSRLKFISKFHAYADRRASSGTTGTDWDTITSNPLSDPHPALLTNDRPATSRFGGGGGGGGNSSFPSYLMVETVRDGFASGAVGENKMGDSKLQCLIMEVALLSFSTIHIFPSCYAKLHYEDFIHAIMSYSDLPRWFP